MSERKLVRARPKAVEYLPEWAKCCDTPVSRDGDDLRVLTVDLSRIKLMEGQHCISCFVAAPAHRCVWSTTEDGREGWFALDCLDLDEGSLDHGR